jgi:hypothetical protein
VAQPVRNRADRTRPATPEQDRAAFPVLSSGKSLDRRASMSGNPMECLIFEYINASNWMGKVHMHQATDALISD